MKNKILLIIADYLITALLWLIFLTCKKQYKGKMRQKEPGVVLFWHEYLAFMPFTYKKYWQKRIFVIISDHKDGEIIARVNRRFGINALRGSSSKNAVRVFVGALRELKNGADIIITPDGPRGPRHFISDGSVTIAQKAGVKVAVLSYSASKFWRFKSWDKMILPKPFSRVTYTLSEPFSLAGLDINEAKKLIASKMPKD